MKWENEPDEFKHLTRRVREALRAKNCLSFGDAAKLTRGEWLRRPNFGYKSAAKLESELVSRGLEFGMEEVIAEREVELPPPLPMDEVSVLHRRLDMAFGLIQALRDEIHQLRKAVRPTTAVYVDNGQRAALARQAIARRLLNAQSGDEHGSCERK